MADLHINQPVFGHSPVPLTQGSVAADANFRNGIIFPSLSRIAGTYTSLPFFNPTARGVRIYVANDAAGGSTAVAQIQVLNPADGVTWINLAGAASGTIGASTGTITTIYPGLTGIADAAGVTINQHLGPIWRVVLTIAVATGVSSVGADYLL
jgi:hypothetical protein